MTAKAGPDAAPAEDDVLVRCLGDFVRHFMGPVTVVRGYTNRVTKPACPDYVLITPMAAARLATNLHLWHADKDALGVTMPTQRRVQVDFYGRQSGTQARTAATLLCDAVGCDFLRPYGVAPLYVTDPQDLSQPDGREQWDHRWMIDVILQANVSRTVPQEYFTDLNLSLHPQA